MSGLTFTLRETPPCRLDAGALIPSRLSGISVADIARLTLSAGQHPVCVGDVFDVAGAPGARVQFMGDLARVDFIGAGLDGGSITVDGAAGAYCGAGAREGEISIAGGVGPYAGAGMRGGTLTIAGAAGDFLGGARHGEVAGMRGGVIHVRGAAGAQAGHRMRRGMIVVEGDTGAYPGAEMIAGTLVVFGRAGVEPGLMMRRGSLVVAGGCEPGFTFADSGQHDFVWLRLLKRDLVSRGITGAAPLPTEARRFTGDLASLGKGEILTLAS
jgi:formylmethanofuran dehydrogenase subunit C